MTTPMPYRSPGSGLTGLGSPGLRRDLARVALRIPARFANVLADGPAQAANVVEMAADAQRRDRR